MGVPRVRSQWDRERQAPRAAGEAITKQSFAGACDVNEVMRRWEVTGVLDHVNTAQAIYLDCAGPDGLQDMFSRVADAEAKFMELPSEVRALVDNDASRFVEYLTNPENLEECRRVGILPKEEERDTGRHSQEFDRERASGVEPSSGSGGAAAAGDRDVGVSAEGDAGGAAAGRE